MTVLLEKVVDLAKIVKREQAIFLSAYATHDGHAISHFFKNPLWFELRQRFIDVVVVLARGDRFAEFCTRVINL